MAADLRLVAEYVDRLVTVEFRLSGLPQHTTLPLYEAARRAQAGPLAHLAASALLARLDRGSHVFLITGAGMPPWLPAGETDGPLGAASLARALDLAAGAKPVLVVQPNHADPLAAAVTAAGLAVVDAPDFRSRTHASLITTIEPGITAGLERARELFAQFEPRAVIFIEKIGPNRAGYYHGVLGYGRAPDELANMVPVLDLAQDRRVLTIGIGDGGNEIGFGLIADDVRRIQPYGAKCQCPCGQGIAAIAATDILVVAAVSNWGAYAIAANLALELRNPEMLHGADDEALMLERCVQAGAADGATGRPTLSVDGVPLEADVAMVTLLRGLITNALRASDRVF